MICSLRNRTGHPNRFQCIQRFPPWPRWLSCRAGTIDQCAGATFWGFPHLAGELEVWVDSLVEWEDASPSWNGTGTWEGRDPSVLYLPSFHVTLHRVYQTSGRISAQVIYRYEKQMYWLWRDGDNRWLLTITNAWGKQMLRVEKKKKNRVYVVTMTTMRVKCSCHMLGRVKMCAYDIPKKKKFEAGAVP